MPIQLDIDAAALLAPLAEQIDEFKPDIPPLQYAVDDNAIVCDWAYWQEVESASPHIEPAVEVWQETLPEQVARNVRISGKIRLKA